MRLIPVLVALLTILAPVRLTAVEPAPLLDVPFLPQTDALCGGAAAAMMFRYWGDRHADVQQFAPLVDRASGGIDAGRLTAAIRARGWIAEPQSGTLERLRGHLARRQPVILLIEDRPARGRRPARYHFVVAVGLDATHAVLHDPTWGPARRLPVVQLLKAWTAAANWSLVVRPDGDRASSRPAPAPPVAPVPATSCDRAVDAAVTSIRAHGLDAADRLLADAGARCPGSSRPLSEFAGVRFAQQRYDEASALASRAVAIDGTDAYAWDVLGSSRFVQDDVVGALRAWNAIDRPRLDAVRIEGLARTRYALVARLLPLVPNTTLTAADYALASRRIREWPGITRAALRLVPGEDGWTDATVALLERRAVPPGLTGWLGVAARAGVDRELGLDVPGWTGLGDVWSASWRWWPRRPRVALAYAAPSSATRGAVWRVEAFWSAQHFASGSDRAARREEQRHGGVTVSNWIAPDLRYELHAGVDAWTGNRRAVGAGGQLEKRFVEDRVTLTAEGRAWFPVRTGQRFTRSQARVALRSGTTDRGFVTIGTAGGTAVSAAAPVSIWPGAGDVLDTSPLLRAHPLTVGGVVDSPAFGRQLLFASLEQQRWMGRTPYVRVGAAVFVDLARAWKQAAAAGRGPLVADAGVGLRVRLPGRDGVLRLDYGRGVRDGANVFSVGWQP